MESESFSFFYRSPEERYKLRARLDDPAYLPSIAELREIFPVIDPAKRVPFSEESKWNRYIDDEKFPKREVITREYVEKLGNYLIQRIDAISKEKSGPVTILEIGAGDGRMAHFLREYLEKAAPGKADYRAVDTNEWVRDPKHSSDQEMYPVEEMDDKKGLSTYSPDIVLVSWMPPKTDFTAGIRKQDSVKEYILIGHAYEDVCGDVWETWGVSYSEDPAGDRKIPPFEKDGFKLEELKDVSKDQIYHLSQDPFMRSQHPSQTISFKKKG